MDAYIPRKIPRSSTFSTIIILEDWGEHVDGVNRAWEIHYLYGKLYLARLKFVKYTYIYILLNS